MTDAGRRRITVGALAAPALLLALAVATVIWPGDEFEGLSLAASDRSRVSEVRAVLAALPEDPLVLVGMDADLGTYPEIRTATRAVIEDLRSRGAVVAFVSFSAEGRAVAAAELGRLRDLGVAEQSLLDLGFVAGGEAGLVRSVTSVLPRSASGAAVDEVRSRGDGIAAFDLAVVVGGIDFGPRSWVEQVGTRLPQLPMVAIAPTSSQPELAAYLRTGQLAALLATVRDGVAYAEQVATQRPPLVSGAPDPEPIPSSLAMLMGMLVALAVMARHVLFRPGIPSGQSGTDDGPAEDDE